ncbi:uncharacterized protein LOC127807580 [Diospyros lotus]|uniref:uncharacterized protein LOC127807580 n=1 Tax=Diospyros lotus TaxID=55363 RepID=UPI002253D329|nr:uncharacterized protein LOC127807580 [Diospyros lotus]XP_052201521.1 uncharacterized protein LOC127807580 [Diospyros lotus]XP_052201522.1 uncharacterized protein LOC127807580 [Diospyros lotus]XP_052201523.1 uncharacterized protein LOC127807580 [Diospyros lotus]
MLIQSAISPASQHSPLASHGSIAVPIIRTPKHPASSSLLHGYGATLNQDRLIPTRPKFRRHKSLLQMLGRETRTGTTLIPTNFEASGTILQSRAAVMATQVGISPTTTMHTANTVSASLSLYQTSTTKSRKIRAFVARLSSSSPSSSSCGFLDQTLGGQLAQRSNESSVSNIKLRESKWKNKRKRVFFLDVNPLCYNGSTPSLHSFSHWISLFFSQVSLSDPVIAVIDGERGGDYRRQILPSYKTHRRKFSRYLLAHRFSKVPVWKSHQIVIDLLKKLNVPVIKVEDHEADDVVATLVDNVLRRGYRVVVASPDKDFKQLICEDVQIVMPIPELNRWSFYTLKHYMAQYNSDPTSDLSLRCIIGDEVDGVPGIQQLVPGFGQKTALKLLRKHGSLQNLLNAAAVRTVGRQYVQDALTKYADYLQRNYEVLALRRDVNVHLQEEWLSERETCSDSVILSNFLLKLSGETQRLHHVNRSQSSNG